MTKNELVNEYAVAVFQLLKEINKAKSIREDLLDLIDCLENEENFYQVITSKNISKTEKKNLIEKIFKSKIEKILLNTFFYVIDCEDEKILKPIFKKTLDLLDNKMEIVNIKIYSSFELNKSDIDKIAKKIKLKINKEPVFKVIIDKSLIGGIKVCYDDTVLDNSIKNKLSVIRNEMRKAKNYESK